MLHPRCARQSQLKTYTPPSHATPGDVTKVGASSALHVEVVDHLQDVRHGLRQLLGLMTLRTGHDAPAQSENSILGIESNMLFVQTLGDKSGLEVLLDSFILVRGNVFR